MIYKTEAIVLTTRKFRESSLLATLYTRERGRQNYIVKGFRSAKARKKHSYFQPLSIINIVCYHKDGRELQYINETSLSYFYQALQTNPVKITLGLIMAEIIYTTVREEEQNDPLFTFIKQCLVWLDQQEKQLINSFIWFLLHLTRYLGFMPSDQVRNPDLPIFFEPASGSFTNAPTAGTGDHQLWQFLNHSLDTATEVRFNRTEKREMIHSLFQYYQLHIENFREPESLKVFEEVFS